MATWRETHLLIGVFGALLLPPLFFLREPERREVEVKDAAFGPTLRALWTKRRFLAPLFVGQIGVTMADTAAVIWATPVLIRGYHLQLSQFSGWVGGVILIGSVLGSVIGGFGADFGHKSGRRGGLLLTAVISTAIGIPAAFFPIMPTVPGFAAMFFLLVFSGSDHLRGRHHRHRRPDPQRGARRLPGGVRGDQLDHRREPGSHDRDAGQLGHGRRTATSAVSLALTGAATSVFAFGGYIHGRCVTSCRHAQCDLAAQPPPHFD